MIAFLLGGLLGLLAICALLSLAASWPLLVVSFVLWSIYRGRRGRR